MTTENTTTEQEIELLVEQQDSRQPHVLVIDDQFAIRSLFEEVLTSNGYEISLAKDLDEANRHIGEQAFDAVIVDIFLGDDGLGLDLLPRLREIQPHTPAIVISGMASTDHVIEALKAGAYDMLTKPFNIIEMLQVIARAVEKKRMGEENERLVTALRYERDMLEQRVEAATQDLREKVDLLRSLNEQLSTMFQMSQAVGAPGSLSELIERIFVLLLRIIEYEGAFCVIYDTSAMAVNLTQTAGSGAEDVAGTMSDLLRLEGRVLANMADSVEANRPTELIQKFLWDHYSGDLTHNDMLLVPVHAVGSLLGVVGLIRRGGMVHLTQAEERIMGLSISQLLAAVEQRNFVARTGQLASLGELIAEIAHDLRHPMTALRGANRMLVEGWRDEPKRERCLNEIGSNLGRMESLVSELVNFYNPREMNIVPLDVHEVLDKALEVSRAVLESKDIEVTVQYAPGQARILGLTRNLIEAFINLISNGVQAMEEGGRLIVSTTYALDDGEREWLRQQGGNPGGCIRVVVEDNGCGIPEDNHDRVFKRFFTTRPEGHGLGLAVVQRIIRKNLGYIRFESEQGEGTRFFIYLPRA